MKPRGRGLKLALAVVGALVCGSRAPGQQPSFRVSTELIVVDVSVLSRDGTPVKGLAASDFTVRVDGQPRRVRSIKFVDQSVSAPGGAATVARAARFSSNETESTGRLVLIVVDELSIPFGGMIAAAQSIEKLLAGFGPADKIGIAALPGPRMAVEFTRDRARIAAGVKSVTGAAMPTRNTGFNQFRYTVSEAFGVERSDLMTWQQVYARECGPTPSPGCDTNLQMEMRRTATEERTRSTEFVSSMMALLRAMAAVDAPKLVILFSEGFASPEAPSEMLYCSPAATAARAVIYGMRLDRTIFDASVRGTSLPLATLTDDRQAAISSLDTLAGSARGTVFDIIGSADTPFRRRAAEVSGYYLLGVEPEGRDQDGKPHQIKVDVARPGLTVRARREFASRPAAKDEKNLLATTLGSPLSVSDVPLRVASFVLPDEDPSLVRVLVVGEVDRSQAKDGLATVGLMFTDEKGKVSTTQPQRMTLPRTDSGALSLMFSTPLAPGSYTMKVAVTREGRAGSVEHRFDARVAGLDGKGEPSSGRVQVGELLVAAPVAASRKLVPSLEGLVRGDRFISYVQLAVDPKRTEPLSLVFDVVKDEQGPALLSAPGTLEASANAKTRVRVAEASVDARVLPPGDYGMRLTVASGTTPVATLFTPFSLERPRATLRADDAASRVPNRPATPPADAVRFRREDVLQPLVLAPFLEEVARYSPAASRPALELARTGRLEEALQKAQATKPGDPVPAFLRGLSLLAKGDLNPAAVAFREAIAISPELLVGAFYIGACYAAGNKDASAINAWQTSLVALDRYPAVYRFMADAMFRLGQSERARQLLAEAVTRWPDDDALSTRAARATFETGRYEQALEYADRAIQREPADTSVLFLAMRSAFQALIDEATMPPDQILSRLRRYRDLYVAAGGLQQALVDEWVKYAEKVAGST